MKPDNYLYTFVPPTRPKKPQRPKQVFKKGYCKPTYAGSTADTFGANVVYHLACLAKIQKRGG